MSNAHQVCKSGYYVAVISTLVETEDPEKELKPALDLLSPVLEKFVTVKYSQLSFTNSYIDIRLIRSKFKLLR